MAKSKKTNRPDFSELLMRLYSLKLVCDSMIQDIQVQNNNIGKLQESRDQEFKQAYSTIIAELEYFIDHLPNKADSIKLNIRKLNQLIKKF